MSQVPSNQASLKEAWSLEQWLTYLNDIHPSNIELGLERVASVYQNLNLSLQQKMVVTVAGTNGKGTTCALIEQALLAANKTVGVFSSPHLIDYRERVRINGEMLSEAAHCAAFLKVDKARASTSLTYFEFGTLAAMQLLFDAGVDYWLLEVGLGGRLDAVNIVDPNIAVITGIDLDHQDWLGNSKELIAKEKAGIFRPNIAAVIGEPEPPKSLQQAVVDDQVDAKWQGRTFSYKVNDQGFNWQGERSHFDGLSIPHIPLQNASTALQVIELLKLELDQPTMNMVFQRTQLAGRRQVIQHNPTVMLDVAHNPQAARLLACDLQNRSYKRLIAVVAMLVDKDIADTLAPMLSLVDTWYCADLNTPRGAKASQLVSVLTQAEKVLDFSSVEKAYSQALQQAEKEDCVIVFGSFFTIADILSLQAKYLLSED